MIDKEYDAFGPWIYEINEEHPMPDLFKPYYKPRGNHLFLVKIPVNTERRSLKPGMNMYDYVIGAYDQDILIMKRTDAEVGVKTINYGEILTVEHTVNLLKGTLRIVTRDDEFFFNYNTVSENLMNEFIHIIRERYTDKKVLDFTGYKATAEESLSFHFANLLQHERKSVPDLLVAGHEQTSKLSYIKRSTINSIIEMIFKPMLMERMFCTDGKELFIISSDHDISYRHIKHHGIKHSYIPFSSIDHVDSSMDEKFRDLTHFRITMKNGYVNNSLCSSMCGNSIVTGIFSRYVH